VRPLQRKWQVAQQKDKKPRPLGEVLHEFQGKVIKAAQKLQLKLSDSAEHPTLQDGMTSSVVSPAHETSFNTLKDLRHWLDHLSEPDQSSALVCRVRDALRVLELQSSRDTRKHIQALLKAWDIKQKESPGKKHSMLDVQQRLSSAVLAEGSRLRSLTRSAGSLSSRANFERMFRSGKASLALDTTARARSRSPQTNRSSLLQRLTACLTVRTEERFNCKSGASVSSAAQPAGADISAA